MFETDRDTRPTLWGDLSRRQYLVYCTVAFVLAVVLIGSLYCPGGGAARESS